MALLFGNKLSQAEQQKVFEVCKNLGWSSNAPDWLMLAVYVESSFKYPNTNAIGATGYIQITKSRARELGISPEALATLPSLKYWDYVQKYFEIPNVATLGKPQSAADLYLLINYPIAKGKPDNYVLYAKGSKEYANNSGLDFNKDGKVTVLDVKQYLNDKVPLSYKTQLLLSNAISSPSNILITLLVTLVFGGSAYYLVFKGGWSIAKEFLKGLITWRK